MFTIIFGIILCAFKREKMWTRTQFSIAHYIRGGSGCVHKENSVAGVQKWVFFCVFLRLKMVWNHIKIRTQESIRGIFFKFFFSFYYKYPIPDLIFDSTPHIPVPLFPSINSSSLLFVSPVKIKRQNKKNLTSILKVLCNLLRIKKVLRIFKKIIIII